MAESTKLKPINNEVDAKLLDDWRASVPGNVKKRDRLEESLRDNIKKHSKTTE